MKKGLIVLLVGCLVIFAACKREFDAPPEFVDPAIAAQVNFSINDLKKWYTDTLATGTGGALFIPKRGWIIEGVVNADDKSGNYYKQISIQDTKGGVLSGITIRLDRNNLYADFPVGRKIYIKLDGLAIGTYGGLIQLGGSVDNSDPNPADWNVFSLSSDLIDTYVIKGRIGNPVEPVVVTEASLNESFQSVLVRLENAEFRTSDTAKTYAITTPTPASVNLYAKSCTGNQIIVRTSGYSTFAGINVPNGNGNLTAIYTSFNGTKQLVLRDTSDVQLTGARCAAVVNPIISIDELRKKYTGSDVTISTPTSVKGIVISDAAVGKNISAGNIVLQDGTKGMIFYYGTAAATQLASFLPGDSLVVDITGGKLTSYNGMLEMSMSSSSVPSAAALTAANGAGKSVTPVEMTVKQVVDNIATIENTLVKITNATATPAGTYSGNKTLTDATGAMIVRTVTGATFAGATLPTTCQNWTGYVSRFNTDIQLYIRNPATDLTVGTTCGGPVDPSTGIVLGTSPVTFDFNGIGTALPTGITARNGASATAVGTVVTPNTGVNFHWGSFSAGAKLFASATGLTETTDSTTQSTTTNRALGYRQTSSNGDPGAAFVFQIANTTGKNNLALEFKLQSLDKATAPRTVTWSVDYGIGDSPTTFTPVTTTGTMTTGGGTFSNNTITANFGSALNNQSGKVWIRIVALSASTGSGNRPSSAVDDVKISWN